MQRAEPMEKKPTAQPPQKGQNKNKAFQPILRQNRTEVLADNYLKYFNYYQKQHPHTAPRKLQPFFDKMYCNLFLTVTHKTRRPIWKRL